MKVQGHFWDEKVKTLQKAKTWQLGKVQVQDIHLKIPRKRNFISISKEKVKSFMSKSFSYILVCVILEFTFYFAGECELMIENIKYRITKEPVNQLLVKWIS